MVCGERDIRCPFTRSGFQVQLAVVTLIFVFIGLLFFSIAYGILSRVFHIHKEIEEDHNTALGIVIGSIMIGLALIIAAAIHG